MKTEFLISDTRYFLISKKEFLKFKNYFLKSKYSEDKNISNSRISNINEFLISMLFSYIKNQFLI